MFNPGETVVQEFIIPFSSDDIELIIITYKQGDDVIVTKEITSGFDPEGETSTKLSVAFSEGESLLFKELMQYRIQLNVYTHDESRFASKEIIDTTGVQHYYTSIGNHIIE